MMSSCSNRFAGHKNGDSSSYSFKGDETITYWYQARLQRGYDWMHSSDHLLVRSARPAKYHTPHNNAQWKSTDGAHKVAGIEFKTSNGGHFKKKASDTSYGCNMGCPE